MDRAAFAAETRAEFFEDAVTLREHAPKAPGVLGIIGAMGLVLVKRNRVRQLVRQAVDRDAESQLCERIHGFMVKGGNGLRPQLQNPDGAVALQDAQFVIDEIEMYFEDT